MRIRLAVAVIAASFALLGGIFALATPALANQYSGMSSSNTMTSSSNMSSSMHSNMTTGSNTSNTMTSGFMGGNMSMMGFNNTGKMFGIISSLQNDEGGKPAWIATGHWMLTNDTSASNATEGGSTNITDFHAAFYMTALDGSAQHTHQIYNFTQDGDSTTEGNVTTVKGTATVTMKDGPVEDVSTEIAISQGKVIAIDLDPGATEGHFGNTPIYGMTITPEIMQHIMCQIMQMHMNTTTTSTMMGNMSGAMDNMTGMMGGHCNGMQGNTTTATTGEMWK